MKLECANLLVITGPKGVGKDTVVDSLGMQRVVSYATRLKRPGEVDGHDYHFISVPEFLDMRDSGCLIENIEWKNEVGETEYRGTGTGAFDQIFEGENLVWRVSPETAADLAHRLNGKCGEQKGRLIADHTTVVYLGVDRLTNLVARLRRRDQSMKRESITHIVKTEYNNWMRLKSQFPNMVINHEGDVLTTVQTVEKLVEKNNCRLSVCSPVFAK